MTSGRDWLDAALAAVRDDPASVDRYFPAAGRRCGRDAADAARVELLRALPLDGTGLADTLRRLYRGGDAAEKRGVLRALDHLGPRLGDVCTDLVVDALRTNDLHLVAAALGGYAARHLDSGAWRHGVLKCVFAGVPLAAVADLDRRADGELGRMIAALVRERIAAGRDVPADVWLVLDRHPGQVAAAGLRDELDSDVPARRDAARRALAGHADLPR
jgi:hypothetical protein